MQHSAQKLIMDLRIACEEIQKFTKDKSFESFTEDRILQLAIEREFEIIGEALLRLEAIDRDNLEVKIPEYRKIIGFRNLVAHGYDIIDDASLWDFVSQKVPQLIHKIENY